MHCDGSSIILESRSAYSRDSEAILEAFTMLDVKTYPTSRLWEVASGASYVLC
jgi:hypothetical protein